MQFLAVFVGAFAALQCLSVEGAPVGITSHPVVQPRIFFPGLPGNDPGNAPCFFKCPPGATKVGLVDYVRLKARQGVPCYFNSRKFCPPKGIKGANDAKLVNDEPIKAPEFVPIKPRLGVPCFFKNFCPPKGKPGATDAKAVRDVRVKPRLALPGPGTGNTEPYVPCVGPHCAADRVDQAVTVDTVQVRVGKLWPGWPNPPCQKINCRRGLFASVASTVYDMRAKLRSLSPPAWPLVPCTRHCTPPKLAAGAVETDHAQEKTHSTLPDLPDHPRLDSSTKAEGLVVTDDTRDVHIRSPEIASA